MATEREPNGGLELLLAIEGAARDAGTVRELAHLVATDTLRVLPCGQIVVFRLRRRRARIVAVSHLSSVDATSPLVQDLEVLLPRWAAEAATPVAFATVDGLRGGDPSRLVDFAFPQVALAVFRSRQGVAFGGLLLAREEPWSDRDAIPIGRLASTYGHAWGALERPPRHLSAPGWRRMVIPMAAASLVAVGFVPVPLTALAPAEVIARDPSHVTAPIDGVIRTVEIAPNERVGAGTVLVRLVDTAIRSRLDVADRAVEVAQAKEQRLVQAAFNDKAARRDLAVAATELSLAVAERDAAAAQLARTVVKAERAGLAIYGNRREWEGRPVATGERIMQIADPQAVQVRIDMPVKDSVLVRERARVRIYLDSDPLHPLDGELTQATYHATPIAGGGMAFTLLASLDPSQAPPRIGHRGTARVFGDLVPLGFYVLRRPLTALRQMVGL